LEPVRFVGEIYVRDIFSLLDRNPLFVEMFRRAYAAEYLQESKKGDALPYTGEYDPMGIEYLELFYDWREEGETGSLTGTHRLWLHGVGYELRDDVMQEGWGLRKKGTRIQWAVKFSPLAHLLNFPLRVNAEVSVEDSQDVNQGLHNFRIPSPTLAQVIHAVLWELSWAGNPQETDEFVEMIVDAADDANMSEPMPASEYIRMLEDLDEAMNKLTSKIDPRRSGQEDA